MPNRGFFGFSVKPTLFMIGGITTEIIISGIPYRVHTFLASGILQVVSGSGYVDVLAVGGGSGGGGGGSGIAYPAGGGGGEVLYCQNLPLPATDIVITIGAGSADGGNANSLPGEDSKFGSVLTARGGRSTYFYGGGTSGNGLHPGGTHVGGTASGGGGGDSANGTNGSGSTPGTGGNGTICDINGVSTYYAGGGGGDGPGGPGAHGLGGGANTGGGETYYNVTGDAGIVIVRYKIGNW